MTEKHFYPKYRNGDKEEGWEILNVRTFTTKKAAKEYVTTKVKSKKAKQDWHTGNETSRVYYYTDKTWTNENSGEKCTECYLFLIDKL